MTIVLWLLTIPYSFGQERQNSVLSEGQWFKLAVTKDGVYKINQELLSEMGLNLASLDPRTIKIFGNGGKMLPQPNASERPRDLLENAIWISGEEDGSFDPNDFIIFYGQGPDEFLFDVSDQTIDYRNHSYSDTTYYFLTVGGEEGKRIDNIENLGSEHPQIDHFVDYQVYERDQTYLLSPGSGREWYEAIFGTSTKSKDFDFLFPGLIADKPVKIKSHVLSKSQSSSNISVSLNGSFTGQHEIGSVPGTTYSSKAKESIETHTLENITDPDNGSIKVTLDYEGNGNGYLNYLLISANRTLNMIDSSLFFRTWESTDHPFSTYSISGVGPNTRVWNISNPSNVLEQDSEFDGDRILFGASSDELQQYVAFNTDQLSSPLFIKEIPNQNLQGTVNANLIIVTNQLFLTEANRLADLRRSSDNISVAVVEISKIYNEFSSGSQDISAIRDFLKYLWDIDNTESGLQHVLLFGKSSFDYKDRLVGNTNFVPTYESYNSLHPIFSYSSDDYFGFMEEDEGEWKESSNGDHTLDIGVGRIPVTNIDEARIVVDKYYTYSLDINTLGAWKNTISFVADDEDNNLHQRQADRLADTVERYDQVFNKKKIYLDAFQQEVVPGGETSKETYDYLKKAIDNGTFIVNFTGHGGERQWTDERILDFIMIEQWENEYNLPIFITATCEFGRHDTPEIISGAEKTLLREKGGAIALVTTARPVFATQNFELNNAFYKALLNGENGKTLTLGEVFKKTKNNSLSGSVNRNFALLGDPSLRISIPDHQVIIDSVKSKAGIHVDTLNALSRVTLSGSIRDDDSNIISNFSGEVNIILFEKPSEKTTIGSKDDAFEYKERDNILFKGKSSVTNGHFSSEFIVPKNISYQFGKGKFSFYAYSRDLMSDARGASQDIVIGGSAIPTQNDVTPPEITAFMGDSTFVAGGTVKPNTILVAKIFDQSGISISKSGLGQNIQAILDNETTFELNEYYETDLDDFRSGWIHFPIEDLEEGPHSITIKVWDVFNNLSEESIEFTVSEKGAMVLNTLRNYPNPFVDFTNFTFEHNRASEDLNVRLQIFNSNGEIVKEATYDIWSSLTKASGISWDGRNSSGSKLQPGIYFYKVIVRSYSDGATNQLYQKLIIY